MDVGAPLLPEWDGVGQYDDGLHSSDGTKTDITLPEESPVEQRIPTFPVFVLQPQLQCCQCSTSKIALYTHEEFKSIVQGEDKTRQFPPELYIDNTVLNCLCWVVRCLSGFQQAERMFSWTWSSAVSSQEQVSNLLQALCYHEEVDQSTWQRHDIVVWWQMGVGGLRHIAIVVTTGNNPLVVGKDDATADIFCRHLHNCSPHHAERFPMTRFTRLTPVTVIHPSSS